MFGMGTGVAPPLSPPGNADGCDSIQPQPFIKKKMCQTPDIRRTSSTQLNILQTVALAFHEQHTRPHKK